MKSTKMPFNSKSNLICTDGCRINTSFNYDREELAANPDIKSNLNWLPNSTNVRLEEISKHSNKHDFYKFNFSSLK